MGSIGPTPGLPATAEAWTACYGDQVEALVEAGVDALLLETFDSAEQLERLIEVIRRRAAAIPIIAELTIADAPVTATVGAEEAVRFIERMAAHGPRPAQTMMWLRRYRSTYHGSLRLGR